MPMVAPVAVPGHVRVWLLLCGSGNPISGEYGRVDWRGRAACYFGIPLLHVVENEETEEIQSNVVAQLVLGDPGVVAEHLADRSRGLRRDRHRH